MSRSRPHADSPDPIDWVSASEIGSRAYCGRMLWLQKVQRIKPDAAARERLTAGTARHHAHGVRVDWQHRIRQAGLWALALTMLVAFLTWLLLRLWGR